MQRFHHASDRHAILLIFQATDAAGKDGAHPARDVRRKPTGLPRLQFRTTHRC
jgi:polyphosphate kinase 2 (PPK2 family)